MELRDSARRRADALAMLGARHGDLWLATASPGGVAHLVPLSFAWDGEHVILATEEESVSARNLGASGRARLALGSTRDVVMIDARLVARVAVGEAPPIIAERYAGQADWDPRAEDGRFAYLLLRPERIQVWRDVAEVAGRTVMSGGRWLA